MRHFFLLIASIFMTLAGEVFSAEALSLLELDVITAGNAAVVPVDIEYLTHSGSKISVGGDIETQVIQGMQNSQLLMSDNAQQNLQSLININAVNAEVNVLLNLNINIDSSIGSIQQYNVNGSLPVK